MKRFVLFAVIAAASIAALAAVLGAVVYTTPAAQRAVWVSAAAALGVQLFAFAVVLMAPRANVFAAWGLGALLRLVVLAVFALLLVKVMALPIAPALISLVTFFFVTTLVEPVLLK